MRSEPENQAVLAAFETMSDAWAVQDAARFAACYARRDGRWLVEANHMCPIS